MTIFHFNVNVQDNARNDKFCQIKLEKRTKDRRKFEINSPGNLLAEKKDLKTGVPQNFSQRIRGKCSSVVVIYKHAKNTRFLLLLISISCIFRSFQIYVFGAASYLTPCFPSPIRPSKPPPPPTHINKGFFRGHKNSRSQRKYTPF